MDFEQKEISNQDGQIVSLYEFKWGETIWRYTSNVDEKEIVIDGAPATFLPVAISDDGMIQGGSSNNDMTVRMPSNLPMVDLFRSTPPAGSIWLTVRRRHLGDPNDQWFVYWLGTVNNVKKGRLAETVVICRTILASFETIGLRLAWTRNCPHMLYDSECRVDPAAFATAATITAINPDGSIDFTMAEAHPAGYFDGGYLEWEATTEGTLDQRGIESSVTATRLVVFGSSDRLAAGMEVVLHPGCDLVTTTCAGRFNNRPNFGGLEQMSGENPFGEKSVF